MRPTNDLTENVRALSRPRLPGLLLGRLLRIGLLGRITAWLLRGPMNARWATTRVTRVHARLLRMTRGRMRRSWVFAAGQPVIALTTIGRHSGIPHTTTVAVLCHNDKVATVGMNLGMKRNPAWTYNLDATPAAQITLGGRTIAVAARRAVGDEHAQLWNHWLDVQPSAAAFAQLAGREIPIFVLEPG